MIEAHTSSGGEGHETAAYVWCGDGMINGMYQPAHACRKALVPHGLFREPLSVHHLHTLCLPRGEGVDQRCALTLTMPGERRCQLAGGTSAGPTLQGGMP
jgi:hypothetical protein